jgi:hypothetical protein
MTTKFCLGSLLCLAIWLPAVTRAADAPPGKTSDTKPASVQADTTTLDADKSDNLKIKGRLPSGWGKLGITDAQKQAIYKVQASYQARLDALRDQLTDLETKRDADMRGLLTDAQLKRLNDNGEAKVTKKLAADAKKDESKTKDSKTKDDKDTAAGSKTDGAAKTSKTRGKATAPDDDAKMASSPK